MRLKTLRIQNFRAFQDQTIDFDDYTCFVGPNGGGKSTVLYALNVLFRHTAQANMDVLTLAKKDFFLENTEDPVRITATFDQLSTEAKADLHAYVRHDMLVLSAVGIWDKASEAAPVQQRGQRLVKQEFAAYFDADKDGAKAAELKIAYASLRDACPTLPAETVKGKMEAALREYEEAHPDECTLVESEDQFYGFSRGENRLSRHMQWVFVPAVKDATTEESEGTSKALKALVQRTAAAAVDFDTELESIRKTALKAYDKLLDASQSHLDDITHRLGDRLKEWSHPDAGVKVVWNQERHKAVAVSGPVATVMASEHGFEADLSRFGHGLQRCYLLALLQELATVRDEEQPRLILAVEEPELYQHPPQARHLADVLEKLSKQGAEIVLCTHSPLFVRGDRLADVRCVRLAPESNAATVQAIDGLAVDAALAAARGKVPQGNLSLSLRLEKALQPTVNEILFAPYVVLVEGIEDRAYISAWLELTNTVSALRQVGGHIVACDSKGYMIDPLAILGALGTKRFVVFDMDSMCAEKHKAEHEADNRAILRLMQYPDEPAFAEEPLWKPDLAAWPLDLGKAVRESFGADDYQAYEERTRAEYSMFVSGTKKSPMFIGLTLGLLYNDGKRVDLLDKLCEAITSQ